jgi:hypothetical protein
MQTTADKNSGFVLLLVLVVLAIGGTLLAIAARHSGQDAIRAGNAQRQVQLRWGRLSCQDLLLPKASLPLQEQDKQANPGEAPNLEAWRSLTLGGLDFCLILGDENAKANPNVLGMDSPGQDPQTAQVYLQRSLLKLQSGLGQTIPVQLRPLTEPITDDLALKVIYPTFDHALAINHPSELVGDLTAEGPVLRRRITCWGSGQLDLRRADMAVIREMLGPYLTDGEMSLLDLARRRPNFSLSSALAQLKLPKEQVARITPLVTDTPNCYSLWVVAKDKTRSWYSLSVIRGGGTESLSHWFFEW